MTAEHLTTPGPLLEKVETYYDEVPRAFARTEHVGPFTLFLRSGDQGWHYYARPTLGLGPAAGVWSGPAVDEVRSRQRALGVPESFEWVAETTPELEASAVAAGLVVARHPLMVLLDEAAPTRRPDDGTSVRMLTHDDPDSPQMLAQVRAAVGAGFGDTDELEPRDATDEYRRLATGLIRMAGAWDAHGAVGGGSHAPRDGVTELAGIAVVPRARRRGVAASLTRTLVDDARAQGAETIFLSAGSEAAHAVYRQLGFRRVGTACIAEPPTA